MKLRPLNMNEAETMSSLKTAEGDFMVNTDTTPFMFATDIVTSIVSKRAKRCDYACEAARRLA